MLFKRLKRGGRHTIIILTALTSTSQRQLLKRMLNFSRTLPQKFTMPLPEMMHHLNPPLASTTLPSLDERRRLADAVAAWHINSPLGICLRRSLLRYTFLREAGLPVTIVFGARLKNSTAGGGIGGHAWLILKGTPYFENPADYEGFVKMYTYPES